MIDKFFGQYRFLSNFYPCPVNFEGALYPSVEHAYQAAKTEDNNLRLWLQEFAVTAGMAKKYGQKLKPRESWENLKIGVMRQLLREKFARPDMKSWLLATEDLQLVEGNTWGDTFWGVCNGQGQNHLGKLLMEIREELKNGL